MSDSDSESASMAAFLGFSSFGKPPSKKRKFNAKTDAFVSGQELENIDRGGKKGKGSGGNDIPLGKQRVIGEKKVEKVVRGNGDEIDLDLHHEEDGPQYEDTSLPPPITLSTSAIVNPRIPLSMHLPPPKDPGPVEEEVEEDGPQYEDTSLPPPIIASLIQDAAIPPETTKIPEEEAAEMQARIDRILESISSAPPPPGMDSLPPSSSILHGQPESIGLPPRPDFGLGYGHGRGRRGGSSAGGSSVGGSSRGGFGGGRGGRNEKWYEDYYDHGFNENPWEALEKVKGLDPVGTWVERPKREA